MADFSPKKEASKAKGGTLAHDNAEHQAPPTIYLQHHHLEKLGMKKMPAVGSKVKISGLAHVGATSENHEHGDGGKKRSMTLHMHKMDVAHDGIGDEEKSESQKAGAKAEIDKALAREMGGSKSKGSEGTEGSGKRDSTPRGSNGPSA